MGQLLVVSPAATTPSDADPLLASLSLLPHTVSVVVPDPDVLNRAETADVLILDGRADLATARQMCRLFEAAGSLTPILLILTEGGFAAVTRDWKVADIALATAGPAELDARVRLIAAQREPSGVFSAGGITIDEAAYSAQLNGHPLDLTYTEFELLKYLVQHPGRVFTREVLLSNVWGYDYYGGTRTVDVHVRRLRAKLGVDHESLISTVRNVGYRFSPESAPRVPKRL